MRNFTRAKYVAYLTLSIDIIHYFVDGELLCQLLSTNLFKQRTNNEVSSGYYKHIKTLEESEVYITRIALEYRPKEADAQASQASLFLFDRFIGFSRNRAATIRAALKILEIIDEKIVE